ncbi:hypothetical protein PTKIN_Ptkin15bG0163700 [Pterospermum kingtungense]
MKKLNRKGQVHPSPPPPPATITDHLSMLPATILSLTAALSLQDKEVLAYLISCSSSSSSLATTTTTTSNNFHGHDSTFECYCFRCYMCFWARWDSSPNRQLIHEIIEAYEEVLQFQDQKKQVKKKNKKGRRNGVCFHDPNHGNDHGNDQGNSGEDSVGGEDGEVVEAEIGSIMKIVGFIRDSVWEAWKIF